MRSGPNPQAEAAASAKVSMFKATGEVGELMDATRESDGEDVALVAGAFALLQLDGLDVLSAVRSGNAAFLTEHLGSREQLARRLVEIVEKTRTASGDEFASRAYFTPEEAAAFFGRTPRVMEHIADLIWKLLTEGEMP